MPYFSFSRSISAKVSARRLRGTVASSRIVVGETRATADRAVRRAAARRAASSAFARLVDLVRPDLLQDLPDPLRLLGDDGGVAVHLDQEEGGHFAGEADLRCSLRRS